MTGYTPTPDFYNDYIAHTGVKGMKWGKRKNRKKNSKPKKMTQEQKEKYYASKMADDVDDGRRVYGRSRIVGSGSGTKVLRGVDPKIASREGMVVTATTSSRNKQGNANDVTVVEANQNDFEKEYMSRLRRRANK